VNELSFLFVNHKQIRRIPIYAIGIHKSYLTWSSGINVSSRWMSYSRNKRVLSHDFTQTRMRKSWIDWTLNGKLR